MQIVQTKVLCVIEHENGFVIKIFHDFKKIAKNDQKSKHSTLFVLVRRSYVSYVTGLVSPRCQSNTGGASCQQQEIQQNVQFI